MIQAKKTLGQNFLRSEKALGQIIEAADIQADDTIIEIGPGEGVLTRRILEKNPERLILVEKDDRLVPILEKEFIKNTEKGQTSVDLIHSDILEVFDDVLAYAKPSRQYKVVANIPYYITGAILRMIFESERLPERAVLLVQKEVADRIIAEDKKESILSMSVKYYGMPKRIAVVPKGAFAPAPSVDSAILQITNIRRPGTKEDEARFFTFIKAAFAHKRKLLVGNIKSAGHNLDLSKIDHGEGGPQTERLASPDFVAKSRAEDLTLDECVALSETLE